jgi:hypothetical protein
VTAAVAAAAVASAAVAAVPVPPAAVHFYRAASGPWPLPAQYHPFYTYWFMGATKRYMLPQSDESIDQLVQLLDRQQQQQQQ